MFLQAEIGQRSSFRADAEAASEVLQRISAGKLSPRPEKESCLLNALSPLRYEPANLPNLFRADEIDLREPGLI
jgi:hypothetical protein